MKNQKVAAAATLIATAAAPAILAGLVPTASGSAGGNASGSFPGGNACAVIRECGKGVRFAERPEITEYPVENISWMTAWQTPRNPDYRHDDWRRRLDPFTELVTAYQSAVNWFCSVYECEPVTPLNPWAEMSQEGIAGFTTEKSVCETSKTDDSSMPSDGAGSEINPACVGETDWTLSNNNEVCEGEPFIGPRRWIQDTGSGEDLVGISEIDPRLQHLAQRLQRPLTLNTANGPSTVAFRIPLQVFPLKSLADALILQTPLR